MNPIKTKKFTSPSAAAKWLNLNPAIQFVALSPLGTDGKRQALLYRDGAQDRIKAREEAVDRAIGRLSDFESHVPLATLTNAVRNLKCFEGCANREVNSKVITMLPELGYGVTGVRTKGRRRNQLVDTVTPIKSGS